MVKILIIDDDAAVCSTLAHFFSNKNYQVLIANNGEEGLSIVEEQQPHQKRDRKIPLPLVCRFG